MGMTNQPFRSTPFVLIKILKNNHTHSSKFSLPKTDMNLKIRKIVQEN